VSARLIRVVAAASTGFVPAGACGALTARVHPKSHLAAALTARWVRNSAAYLQPLDTPAGGCSTAETAIQIWTALLGSSRPRLRTPVERGCLPRPSAGRDSNAGPSTERADVSNARRPSSISDAIVRAVNPLRHARHAEPGVSFDGYAVGSISQPASQPASPAAPRHGACCEPPRKRMGPCSRGWQIPVEDGDPSTGAVEVRGLVSEGQHRLRSARVLQRRRSY
jgi:hypothetical protein